MADKLFPKTCSDKACPFGFKPFKIDVPSLLLVSVKTTGVLIPAFSTRRRGDLGIGDTLSMVEWIDWAADFSVGFLQLLPINENGTDESPYSAISSIALDPIYLAFEPDHIPCLTQADIDSARSALGDRLTSHLIDYPHIRAEKFRLLEISYARFAAYPEPSLAAEFQEFREKNSSWLSDYSRFKLLIEIHGKQLTWDEWPENCRDPESARKFIAKLHQRNASHVETRLGFFAYGQWLCFRQWRAVREHADRRGIKLMGDVPIGVSYHSADVFFQPNLFLTDWFGGTSPEAYSAENPFLHEWGQNWGIPLYDWDAMAKTDFAWWRARITHLTDIFRMFRIDHILGFYRIYGFPWHPKRNHEFIGLNHHEAAQRCGAQLPRWFDQPDDSDAHKAINLSRGDFRLRKILEAAGDTEIIAEDLGWVPEYVRPHLDEIGIAGYRIPHWDSYASGAPIMGDAFSANSFATYSTHDHDSLCAVWENCRNAIAAHRYEPSEINHRQAESAIRSLRLLAGFSSIPISQDHHWPAYSDAIHWRLIKSLLESNSRYAVLMATDLFQLPDRINIPGSEKHSNWRLRLNLSPHDMEQYGRILSVLIQIARR
jgi:4-alpha-glucanotransferase